MKTASRRDAIVVALLVAAPFLFYWRLWLPGEARWYFEGGDFVDQFYAFATFEASQLAQGRLPLWNPFAYGGAPFWADIQSAVAYPPSLLVVLASLATTGRLPYVALEIEAVAHIGLAAAFTYLFARRVVGARAPALVSAVTFGFGGYLTGYPPLQLAVLETNVWLPLALLGVERTLAEVNCRAKDHVPGKPGQAQGPAPTGVRGEDRRRFPVPDPLLPLALALAILAGHPQSANYVIYATLAWFAWRARPWRNVRGEIDRRLWIVLAAALGLALAVSAAGWLPALQFLRLSNRAEAGYAMLANGFPPRELLGILVPGITKWSPLYVGVLPLLLAASAVRWAVFGGRGAAGEGGMGSEDRTEAAKAAPTPGPSPKTAGGGEFSVRRGLSEEGLAGQVRFWVVLAVISLVLAIGRHGFVFDLFYLAAPGFDLFRGQERTAFLFSFSLAMLAGAGMRLFVDRHRDIGRTITGGALALAAVGIALAIVAAPLVRIAAIRVALLAAGASMLATLWARGRLRASAVAAASLALIAVDLYTALARVDLVPDAPVELAVNPFVAALRQGATGRVHNDDRLPRNFGVLHGLESTYGSSPLRLRAFDTLYDGLIQSDERRLWDLLAVSDLVTWRTVLSDPAEAILMQGEGETATYLYQIESTTPYAWRVSSAERAASDGAALERLRAADFDPLSTVILHDGAPGGPHGRQSGIGNVVRAPGEVAVQTTGDGAGWIVFSEMHYPGWRATVDGAPAPVLRADIALVAVPVPPGDHAVRLWFTAPWVWAGLATSGVAAALLAAMVLVGWVGRRRARDGNQSVAAPVAQSTPTS